RTSGRAGGDAVGAPGRFVHPLRVRAMNGHRNDGWVKWLLRPPLAAPPATIVVRAMAGGGFFWGGVPACSCRHQGVGRFARRRIPFPVFSATFGGWLETVGGPLLLPGLGTRLIAIPFIVEMLVAMLSTKPRLYLGTLPLPPPPAPPIDGLGAVLHE